MFQDSFSLASNQLLDTRLTPVVRMSGLYLNACLSPHPRFRSPFKKAHTQTSPAASNLPTNKAYIKATSQSKLQNNCKMHQYHNSTPQPKVPSIAVPHQYPRAPHTLLTIRSSRYPLSRSGRPYRIYINYVHASKPSMVGSPGCNAFRFL